MQLSNILLENLKGKALEQISSIVGGNTVSTKSIASKALPLILEQLEKNTQTKSWAESLNQALNSHLWVSKIDLNDGSKILGHIFENTQKTIWDIASSTGQSEEQTWGVMSALSSVIMETLWDHKSSSGGFTANDLTKLLSGTGKDIDILWMVIDQDGDGDFDSQDAVKFGMNWIKNKFFK